MTTLMHILPIAAFFIGYLLAGIYAATASLMVACCVQWLHARAFQPSALTPSLNYGLIAVLVLGSMTLVFRDESFIKLKPTLVFCGMGLALLLSLTRHEPIPQRMIGDHLTLTHTQWRHLSLGWSTYFFCLGIINAWIAYSYSTDIWVTFKVFGLGLLSLAFIACNLAVLTYLKAFKPIAQDLS